MAQTQYRDYNDFINNNPSMGGPTRSASIANNQAMVGGQQDYIIKQQLDQAKKYRQNLGENIEGDYSAERNRISGEYDSARKNLVGNLNARGMAKSGQSRMQQGGLMANRDAELLSARGNVIDNANRTATALETDPMFGLANINEANTRQQSSLDEIKNSRDAYRNSLIGAGVSNIGKGVGTGVANIYGGYSFGGNK